MWKRDGTYGYFESMSEVESQMVGPGNNTMCSGPDGIDCDEHCENNPMDCCMSPDENPCTRTMKTCSCVTGSLMTTMQVLTGDGDLISDSMEVPIYISQTREGHMLSDGLKASTCSYHVDEQVGVKCDERTKVVVYADEKHDSREVSSNMVYFGISRSDVERSVSSGLQFYNEGGLVNQMIVVDDSRTCVMHNCYLCREAFHDLRCATNSTKIPLLVAFALVTAIVLMMIKILSPVVGCISSTCGVICRKSTKKVKRGAGNIYNRVSHTYNLVLAEDQEQNDLESPKLPPISDVPHELSARLHSLIRENPGIGLQRDMDYLDIVPPIVDGYQHFFDELNNNVDYHLSPGEVVFFRKPRSTLARKYNKHMGDPRTISTQMQVYEEEDPFDLKDDLIDTGFKSFSSRYGHRVPPRLVKRWSGRDKMKAICALVLLSNPTLASIAGSLPIVTDQMDLADLPIAQPPLPVEYEGCDSGWSIATPIENCIKLDDNQMECSIDTVVQATLHSVGSCVCLDAMLGTSNTVLASLKICLDKVEQERPLVFDYWSALHLGQSWCYRKCPGCSCDQRPDDATVWGKIDQSRYPPTPGVTTCHKGGACATHGCFSCKKNCQRCRAMIRPIGNPYAVLRAQNAVLRPTLSLSSRTDEHKPTTRGIRWDIASVESFDDWDIIYERSDHVTDNLQMRHIYSINEDTFITSGSEKNKPTRGNIGDIQGATSDLSGPDGFIWDRSMMDCRAQTSGQKCTFARAGYFSAVKTSLPAVIDAVVYDRQGDALVNGWTKPVSLGFKIKRSGDAKVRTVSSQVCPVVEHVTTGGCAGCNRGVDIEIKAVSTCFSGPAIVRTSSDCTLNFETGSIFLESREKFDAPIIHLIARTARRHNTCKFWLEATHKSETIELDFEVPLIIDDIRDDTDIGGDHEQDDSDNGNFFDWVDDIFGGLTWATFWGAIYVILVAMFVYAIVLVMIKCKSRKIKIEKDS